MPSSAWLQQGSQYLTQVAVGKFISTSDQGHRLTLPGHYMHSVRSAVVMEGVMTWTSDSKWSVVHSTLATLLILSWAYIAACGAVRRVGLHSACCVKCFFF